jgi:DNA (cytosine-5)-methyltransferase 1
VGGAAWHRSKGRHRHENLIAATRELLKPTRRPWVIENVPTAPLEEAFTICGLSLGIGVKRHRSFAANFPELVPPCGDHSQRFVLVFGGGVRGRARRSAERTSLDGTPYSVIHRPTLSLSEGQAAMGIDWMNADELSQAMPPAYTEWIGRQLMAASSQDR